MIVLGKTLPMITAESKCASCNEAFGDTEGLGALLFTPQGTDAVCVGCVAQACNWAAQVAEGVLYIHQNRRRGT